MMERPLRLLFVTPECFPLVKTGGLADVSAALPAALHRLGVDVRLLLPGFPGVLAGLGALRHIVALHGLPGDAGGELLLGTTEAGIPAYVLDVPEYFRRDGHPYMGPNGRDWPDNALRFGALAWAATALGLGRADPAWRPQVVHGNDWQSGLAPAYLALSGSARPATVLTIHNIAYQGQFPAALLNPLRLPRSAFSLRGVEYYGDIGFLKAGLYYSDRITTVSPRYADEIKTPAHGAGLHGLLEARSDALTGILNGVDYDIWDPRRDPDLPARYDADHLEAKASVKAHLQNEFGLAADPDRPLFGLVSRLTWHKGVDVVLDAAPDLIARGGQLVVLGNGDGTLERRLGHLASEHPAAVGLKIGYDEPLAHRLIAGADILMVPSRSEPCGLTQLYALRYGTPPMVGRTGGLADTIVEANPAALAAGVATGFAFDPGKLVELTWVVRRALELYRDPPTWRRLQRAAMAQDFGWGTSARAYRDLYLTLIPPAMGEAMTTTDWA